MTCRRAAWLALAFAGCVASVHAAQVPAPAPVEAGTWEASRLFVDHTIPQRERRRRQDGC